MMTPIIFFHGHLRIDAAILNIDLTSFDHQTFYMMATIDANLYCRDDAEALRSIDESVGV